MLFKNWLISWALPIGLFRLNLDFGGDGGGSQTSTSTNVMYSPEESAARAEVLRTGKSIFDATKGNYGPGTYPGAPPVGFSPYTVQARQAVLDALPGAKDTLGNYNNAINFGLGGVLFPESNPALQSTINAAVRPITESYTDPGGVMSQIRTGAGLNEQFGGSRQGIAEGVAAGRYADAVGDASAKIATEGYNKGLDTFGKALALTPSAISANLTPTAWLSGLGTQDETLAQQTADYETAKKNWDMSSQWIPFQNYASLVNGMGSSSTSSTATTPTPQADPFSQLLGAATSAYSLYKLFALL